jgi:hypothetical protein
MSMLPRGQSWTSLRCVLLTRCGRSSCLRKCLQYSGSSSSNGICGRARDSALLELHAGVLGVRGRCVLRHGAGGGRMQGDALGEGVDCD